MRMDLLALRRRTRENTVFPFFHERRHLGAVHVCLKGKHLPMTATTPDSRSPDAFRQDSSASRFACDVLRFGEFKTKSGRLSPYFFNSGLFNTSESFWPLLRRCRAGVRRGFDMTFGPGVQGIPLVSAGHRTCRKGHNLPYSFNRKEARDHGEGGLIVGAAQGRVLIVDDVITAGTSVRVGRPHSRGGRRAGWRADHARPHGAWHWHTLCSTGGWKQRSASP